MMVRTVHMVLILAVTFAVMLIAQMLPRGDGE